MSIVASRFVKPLVLGVMCGFGCMALGSTLRDALLIGAVPFLFGFLNILAGQAFTMAALIFVAGVSNQIHPWSANVLEATAQAMQTARDHAIR